MAHVTADHSHSTFSASAALAAVATVGSGFWNLMVKIAEGNVRSREIQRLQSLSDDALAARGLTRESIVHHVYRDMMHT